MTEAMRHFTLKGVLGNSSIPIDWYKIRLIRVIIDWYKIRLIRVIIDWYKIRLIRVIIGVLCVASLCLVMSQSMI
jgi:hypothetical protein